MLRHATILGSGGFIPTGRRETSCLLIRTDGPGAIVVDAGTGARRLLTDPALLDGVREIDVLLSHFHADHICGLPYLSDLEGITLRLWGPGAALYDGPTEQLVAPIFSLPIQPFGVSAVFDAVNELPVGELELHGVKIRTRRQDRHANPSVGFRFDDVFTWCTDTAYDEGTADFARGSGLLCHDAWGFGARPEETGSHTTGAQVAQIATDAAVPRLLLIHVPPLGDADALLAEARETRPDAELATDEMALL